MPTVSAILIDANGVKNPNQVTTVIDRPPDVCPLCRVTVVPENFSQGFGRGDWLEMYYRCVNQKCLKSFIAIYDLEPGRTTSPSVQHFQLRRCVPVEPQASGVADEITALSPSFVKIYAQAQTAQDHGLDEIAGPGFVRLLSFLSRITQSRFRPTTTPKTRSRRFELGSVTAKYLPGDKLPVVSKRAAWLGNDETHYERRWVGKD